MRSDKAREILEKMPDDLRELAIEYGDLLAKENLTILYDWVIDDNREPANTKFTSGDVHLCIL
jgi:hypothetical protein